MNGNGAQYLLAPGAQYLQLNQQQASGPYSSPQSSSVMNPEINIELSDQINRSIISGPQPGFGVTVSSAPFSNAMMATTTPTIIDNSNGPVGNHTSPSLSPTSQAQHGQQMMTANTSESQMLRNRKVFVQRDYSFGTVVRFQTKFPPELEGQVERVQFEHLIQKVNEIFEQAESLSGKTVLKNCLACMSAFFLYGCMETEYDRCMRRLRQFLDQQNALVWNPRGMTVNDPLTRGLRVLEIEINDV